MSSFITWLKNYCKQVHSKHPSNKLTQSIKKHQFIWVFNSESVARGVAVGLFVACVPIVPFQTLLILFLSILLRANFPVAFGISWVSNPLTIIPLIYLTYRIGDWVLGSQSSKNFHPEWANIGHSLYTSFPTFGKAFFVGLPILAFGTAMIGYIIVIILGRHFKLDKKK